MTADPKPDAVTADQLRKLAALARPCDCDHDLAYAEIDNMGGWKAIAMKLLDEADKLRAELTEARESARYALTPPDVTAAAARMLLAAWPTDTSFDAAFAACATAYHGGDQMQDTMDRTLATVSAALRALAEVKPHE